MFHKYDAKDITSCLNSRRIVLVGDSTIRQIFWAITKKLNLSGAKQELARSENHSNLRFQSAGVDIEFIWDPYINSSKLFEELSVFRDRERIVGPDQLNTSSSAALVLIGGGLWYARHIEEEPIRLFRKSIDAIVPYMQIMNRRGGKGLSAKPTSLFLRGNDFLYLAPVQTPLYEALEPTRAITISPAKIDPMNQYLGDLSAHHRANVLWSYAHMTSQHNSTYEASGLHVVDDIADRKADVLLNLRCNNMLMAEGRYPLDKTCCTSYSRITWIQWIMLLGGGGIIPILHFTNGQYITSPPGLLLCQPA